MQTLSGYPGKRLMTLNAVARITNPQADQSGPMICREPKAARGFNRQFFSLLKRKPTKAGEILSD